MPAQPLAEVFGFPAENLSEEAQRYRRLRLCPFNNKVPNCTKDKAQDPLGVCSVHDSSGLAITCPVRFRQDWLIAEDAAEFFFPTGTRWTSLTEVRLTDATGQSAGNIDVVLVAYDEAGQITDFGALEVQAVYISGNVRRPFEAYMRDPTEFLSHLPSARDAPRADYLSSSRKRLAPQLIYKGGILHEWCKRSAVALHTAFFNTLPPLPEVPAEEAEMAWFLYDVQDDGAQHRLRRARTVYTAFDDALLAITRSTAGPMPDFVQKLQGKLDEKLNSAPIAPTIAGELEL
ncbi:NotI family restriction endonuclease [Deinococcus frigens]|uniref:NotI family restriction endonuclease n=1 Tax=Deinococcus frigens TaxID=249403 RepID=UPI000495E6B0|nr:NotI family restriction endonuclease [Deinococcus frigens]